MNIGIKIGNILDAEKELHKGKDPIYYAHCISADAKLGKGVAKLLDDKFSIREEILFYDRIEWWLPFKYPWVYTTHWGAWVFNLITKEHYYDKPTYESLQKALDFLAANCKYRKVKTLVMPKIGCGLDGLKWSRVYMMIMKTLKDIPGDCWIYMLPPVDDLV